MSYTADLKFDESWKLNQETCFDEDNCEILHIECHHITEDKKGEDCLAYIDIMDMPFDSSAEEQAFFNYLDIVGFNDDDEGNPILQSKFNGKKSFYFDASCEDGSEMKVICYSPKKDCLAIITINAINESYISFCQESLERGLRIK